MIVEIAWSAIALGGLIRAITLWREAVKDKHALGGAALRNGKRLLARWQIEHAWMGVLIYLFLAIAGVGALLFRFDVIPLDVRLFVASTALVAALLTLATRQERDAHYRKRTLAAATPDDLKDIATDTNERVRDIQERSQDEGSR